MLHKANTVISTRLARSIRELSPRSIKVKAFVSTDPQSITYLSADEEERYSIAQANSRLGDKNQFIDERVEIRQPS